MSAEHWRERVRKHQEAKRNARRAAGLCGVCGERAPKQGYLTCSPCLEKARTDRKALRAERSGRRVPSNCTDGAKENP